MDALKAYAYTQLANYRATRRESYLNRAQVAIACALDLYGRRGAKC